MVLASKQYYRGTLYILCAWTNRNERISRPKGDILYG